MKNDKLKLRIESLSTSIQELDAAFAEAFDELLHQVQMISEEALPVILTRSEGGKNRRAALLAGLTMYMGRPCPRDHDGLRYTSSASCVQCKRLEMSDMRGGRKRRMPPTPTMELAFVQKDNRIRRRDALEANQKFFDAVQPCEHGHVQRYVSNNACVGCERIKRQERGRG